MIHDDSDLNHQLAARITKLRERARDDEAYRIAVARLLLDTAADDDERESAQRMLLEAVALSTQWTVGVDLRRPTRRGPAHAGR